MENMIWVILLLTMGILLLWSGYRMITNQYHFLPVGKKVSDYIQTKGIVECIHTSTKKSRDSDGDIYYYTIYTPIIRFQDNQEEILSKPSNEFRKNNMFSVGDELDILYQKRDVLYSNYNKTFVEKAVQFMNKCDLINGLDMPLSYDYEVYFANPDIYNNEYPKWNKIACFVGGITCIIFGLIILF